MAPRKTSPLVKDILVLAVVFAVLLGALYAYTGVWPPAVIVESGSMMHLDTEVTYGRIGTIDPGDMVFVKKVNSKEDVETWADTGEERYGRSGDVIVFWPANKRDRTPIIHRAVAWVTVDASSDTRYLVRWNPSAKCPGGSLREGPDCVFDKNGITIEQVGLHRYTPATGGFVTKGDNPVTNSRPDQQSYLSSIVQPEWIQGKARGEVPWLGLIKLAISPRPNENNPPAAWVKIGSAYAPKDLWVMLGVSLFVLIGLPVAFDVYKAVVDRRARQQIPRPPAQEVAPPPPSPPPSAPPPGGDVPPPPPP